MGLLAAIAISTTSASASHFSFNPAQWYLVSHVDNSGVMFPGNPDLSSTYSYGSFVSNPTPTTPDFYRPFSDQLAANPDIIFVTGDHAQWAIFNYQELLNAKSQHLGDVYTTNIAVLDVGLNSTDIGPSSGAVLFRGVADPEDPWISVGYHLQGVINHQIFWGENGFNNSAHGYLNINDGGMNVYVGNFSNIINGVPEPSTYALFGLGAIGMLIALRRKKTS